MLLIKKTSLNAYLFSNHLNYRHICLSLIKTENQICLFIKCEKGFLYIPVICKTEEWYKKYDNCLVDPCITNPSSTLIVL